MLVQYYAITLDDVVKFFESAHFIFYVFQNTVKGRVQKNILKK